MEKFFIQDFRNLEAGSKVEGVFAVRRKNALQQYKGKSGYYFKIEVSDKTGSVTVNFWGRESREEVEEVYNSFDNNDLVFISGTIKLYNEKVEIHVNQSEGIIRKAVESEYDAEDFIPSTNQSIDDMENELRKNVDSINTESVNGKFINALLLKFFDDKEFMEKFRKWPAAVMYHHACKGGLMEHTLEVVRLCNTICDIHPTGIDRDLVIAGAILHDIGKTRTIVVKGVTFQDNEESVLRDHISIAEEMIIEKIDEIEIDGEKFPESLKNKLLHIILSHHGKKENGSPVEPATPEAVAVYLSDLLSSLVTQYIRAQKDIKSDDFKTYQKPIEWVYLDHEKKRYLNLLQQDQDK